MDSLGIARKTALDISASEPRVRQDEFELAIKHVAS